MNTHFCFSELLILREKKIRGFSFGPLEYQKKKITNFQKTLKKYHTGELHKKCKILHQAPQITLFLLTLYVKCKIEQYCSVRTSHVKDFFSEKKQYLNL